MSNLEVEEAPSVTKSGETKDEEDLTCGNNAKRGTDARRIKIESIIGVRIGVLVGITDDGRVPLVCFAGQAGSSAVQARATLDLHGSHVGREVVLMFEEGDPRQPIVIGCLACESDWQASNLPSLVEVDVDGERLVVSAKEQLVLRCGKARITLTKAGKVLINGTYLSSHSSGVNRIKGGSIRLN